MPDFSDDWFRMTGRSWNREKPHARLLRFLNSHALRYLYAYRKVQRGEDPLHFFRFLMAEGNRKYGLRLESFSIGKGLYLGHPYNIFVCQNAVLGADCNLNKGASIRTKEPGDIPKLGDRVWVGVNAVIEGNITIGDNVLIAPNVYVNRDVPSDSIVIGNPCQVFTGRPDATEGYIHNVR